MHIEKIQNIAAGFFIFAIGILAVISVFGVWDFLDGEVIFKSFQTLGLLGGVAGIVIFAGRFTGNVSSVEKTTVPEIPNPIFKQIRNITLTVLIVSSSLLALLGVFSIWEVIEDIEILHKSLSSLAILAFSSLIIVMVCLEREKNVFWKEHHRPLSGGAAIALVVVFWIFASIML